MPALRLIFFALALWGAVMPMLYFVPWLRDTGFDLPLLVQTWKANDAVTGLYWDLVISAIALTLWVLAETISSRNWRGLWALPATWLVGVSCGLPLYLALRVRHDS